MWIGSARARARNAATEAMTASAGSGTMPRAAELSLLSVPVSGR